MEKLLNFKDYFNRFKRKVILDSYYTRQIKNGKGMSASIIDWVFITLLLVIFFLITTFNTTTNIIVSIVLTGVLVGLYLASLIVFKTKARGEEAAKINNDLAGKQVMREISRYGNRDFLLYAKDLLEKYYNTTFFEYDRHIDFIGEINGEIYGVKCIKNPMDSLVVLKSLEYYIREMKDKNIQEGIVITNSYFADEVRKETNYILIDFNQIKDILMKIETYPSNEEIEESIIARHNAKRGKLRSGLSLYRKDKIYKFILLGIILYSVSFFVAYKLYYKIMGLLSIGAGVIIGIYNMIKYFEKKKQLNP